MDAHEIFANELADVEPGLAKMVRDKIDNSHGGIAAIRAINRAVAAERERCAAIIQAARFGEIERDWRSLVHMIEGGETIEQIQKLSSQ